MKWFERKFDFKSVNSPYYTVLERLRGTPIRLQEKLLSIPEDILIARPEHSWSIKENAGHLSDLETLWQGRLEDILNGEIHMRPTDLNNTPTNEANHNQYNAQDLMNRFQMLREQTVQRLEKLKPYQVELSALHPRLHIPMRVTDLFFFVAEHDDHHLARITEMYNVLHLTKNKIQTV